LSDEPNSQLPVKLRFNDMSDFEPPQIARQVPALRKLFEARQQLDNLRRYMDGRVDAEQRLKELLEDPSLMQALRDRAGPRPGGDAEAGAGEEENQTA
jgi:type VI secretion system protein ImpB